MSQQHTLNRPIESTPDDSLLGKATLYPESYQPDVLFPIPRQPNREKLPVPLNRVALGVDWWHVFEVSWLSATGKPMVAIARLAFPANSPCIIESKSLKLYFNSLNFKTFDSAVALADLIVSDLSPVAGAKVGCDILPVDALLPVSIQQWQPASLCLDDFEPAIPYSWNQSIPADTLLGSTSHTTKNQPEDYWYYSHLLRSQCPVTGQPDWGTLQIRIQGVAPDPAALLAYVLSYRQHQDFHEQCVESIFADLWTILQPEKLMVSANYTRRGGLDINPCRVSHLDWLPPPMRLSRQ